MTALHKKIAVAGLVVVGALAYLGSAGVTKGWVYYLKVDEFVGNARYQNQRVKLCGTVARDGVEVSAGKLTASFTLAGEQRKLPVMYRGVIPEMFRPESEVVVEGKLNSSGVFQADVLLTKCASKYDPNDPAHKGQQMPAGHPAVTRNPIEVSRAD
jgi:cytochrome c-type biogenesis protein CcmE